MGTSADHQSKWVHNRQFLASMVSQADFADWMATVTFYVAVHAVEALFDCHGFHTSSHEDRNRVLKIDSRYAKIQSHYYHLYSAARVARYACSSADWIDVADVHDKLIKTHLYGVENSVKKLGNLSPALPQLFTP